MTFGVAFQFDSRYTGLEGKWVSANFRYYSVDPAGRRTSGYGHTDYGAPALLASTKRNPNTGVVYSDYAHLSNGWVQWAGQRLRADVNIAVWDGRQWIYTGWLTIPTYTSYYWDGLQWSPRTLSDCLT